MTIEQISENRLKVTVSNSELYAYELANSDFESDSQIMKQLITDIVKAASEKSGFNSKENTLIVESVARPDRLIFFITKIPKRINEYKSSAENKKIHFTYFIFPDKTAFVRFFETVKNEDFSKSLLYKLQDRYFFKTVTDSRLHISALEFANPVYSNFLIYQISKKAQLVCRGRKFFKFI